MIVTIKDSKTGKCIEYVEVPSRVAKAISTLLDAIADDTDMTSSEYTDEEPTKPRIKIVPTPPNTSPWQPNIVSVYACPVYPYFNGWKGADDEE